MIVALRSWRDIAAIPPLGPKARAVSLTLGAVLLWATWPTLATWAQPAPPFLVLGLRRSNGRCSFAVACRRHGASACVCDNTARDLSARRSRALGQQHPLPQGYAADRPS